MITHIEISGFKSFDNFQLDFAPFTVVGGVNASGKSNLFDALRLLAGLATTDIRTAFSQQGQRGDIHELFSCYSDGSQAKEMSFAVEVLVQRNVTDNWGQKFEINHPRLRYELKIRREESEFGIELLKVAYEQLAKIDPSKDCWAERYLTKKSKKIWRSIRAGGSNAPFISTKKDKNGVDTINIRQDSHQGGRDRVSNTINQTVLSSVSTTDFPHVFAVKQELAEWNFLQLNPEVLRMPAKLDVGLAESVGYDGANLASVMYRMKMEDPHSITEVSNKLCSFLKEYRSVDVEKDEANRVYMITLENTQGVRFTSRVLSEGTLRLLTLCVMLYNPAHRSLLCFEEPENGIHSKRIIQMVDLLHELAADFSDADSPLLRQVIVNTHSVGVIRRVFSMCQYKEDCDVELLWSQNRSRSFDLKDRRVNMNATRMIPVDRNPQQELSWATETEKKICLAEVSNILEKGGQGDE